MQKVVVMSYVGLFLSVCVYVCSVGFREFDGQRHLAVSKRWYDRVRRRRWLRVMGLKSAVRSQARDESKQLKESLRQLQVRRRHGRWDCNLCMQGEMQAQPSSMPVGEH